MTSRTLSGSRNRRLLRQRHAEGASGLCQKLTCCWAVLIVARMYSPVQRLPISQGSLNRVIGPGESTLRMTWRRPALSGRRSVGTSAVRGLVRGEPKAPTRLRGRFALQGRGPVLGAIPAQNEGQLGAPMSQAGKLLPRPEAGHPQAVKGFDLVIAL